MDSMTFGVLKRGAKSMNHSPYAGSLAVDIALVAVFAPLRVPHRQKCAARRFRTSPNLLFPEARSLTRRIQAKNNQTT
jgi:hypothetical protein